jgi:hypothetical protein
MIATRGAPIMDDIDDSDEFFETFKKHLTDVDELANVILKGHFLVEQDLDEAISVIFFHPDHVLDGRLSFERKVQIARAMSIRSNNLPTWDVLLALNSMRNEIAHNPARQERKKKMDRLRQTYLANFEEESRKQHEKDSSADIVVHACALCSGFLAYFTDDIVELRKHIDKLDERLHPDEERLPIRLRD